MWDLLYAQQLVEGGGGGDQNLGREMRKIDWHLGKMGKRGVGEDCLHLRPDANSRPGPSGHSRLRCRETPSEAGLWDRRPRASRAQEDRVARLKANPSVRAWLSASRGWRATGRALSLEPGLGGAPHPGPVEMKVVPIPRVLC